MTRVPAALALLALQQSGYTVSPGAFRNWVWRGYIKRHPDGYDLTEIRKYIKKREARAEAQKRDTAAA